MRRTMHGAQQSLVLLRKWGLAITLCTIGIVFGVLVFSPLLQVREIRVQRSEMRVDIERVQQVLSPLFSRHLLFLSTHDVTSLLAQAFPDFDAAEVSKHYPSQLVVRLKLKPVLARLYIEEPPAPPPLVTGTGARIGSGALASPPLRRGVDYLTTNGIYVVLPGSVSGALTLNLVDWSLRPSPNARLFSEGFLTALRDAEAGVKSITGQELKKRTVYLRAREFQLQLRSGPTLWFDTRSPIQEQLQRLTLFLRAQPLEGVNRYVDLRLSGKVVYR